MFMLIDMSDAYGCCHEWCSWMLTWVMLMNVDMNDGHECLCMIVMSDAHECLCMNDMSNAHV